MASRKKKHAEPSPDEVHRPDARSASDTLDAMTALDKIRVSIDAVAHGVNRLTQVIEGFRREFKGETEAPVQRKPKTAAVEPEIEPEPESEPTSESEPTPPKPVEKPKADTGPVDAESVKAALLQYAKVHGREKLVALFTAHGGTKLADVPPGRMKALKAAAEAGV